MEKVILRRQNEETTATKAAEDADATKKFPIMRTLAKFHECDVKTLSSRIEANELDIYGTLREMFSRGEVESLPSKRQADGGYGERFGLTSKGWTEYLKALGSIYELSDW
jgi:hypothetical protein